MPSSCVDMSLDTRKWKAWETIGNVQFAKAGDGSTFPF